MAPKDFARDFKESLDNFTNAIKEIAPNINFSYTPIGKIPWDCYDIVWYKARKHQIKRLAQGWRLGLFE